MLDERTSDDDLGRELHALVADLEPRAGLADTAIARRRSMRRRAGVGTGGLGVAAAVSAGAVLALGSGTAQPARVRLDGPRLHLAAYHFALPKDASPVAATPAACAIPASVVYPGDAPPSDVGATSASEPAIANAVTSAGGCLSMTITNAYTPGSADAPTPAFMFAKSPITVDGDTGDVGTQELIGRDANGGPLTINGVTVPSGTTDNALDLEIPVADGQVQMLLVTAAGVSQSELQSIVASGLNQ
jgi:hypothetical protein